MASLFFLAENFPDHGANGTAQNWGKPEQPELLQRPPANEQGLPGRAGRIDGCVGDRNGNQMNKGECKTDGDRCETDRHPAMRRPQYDNQEKRRQDDLDQQRRQERISARRMLAITIGGKTADFGTGLAGENNIKRRSRDDRPRTCATM